MHPHEQLRRLIRSLVGQGSESTAALFLRIEDLNVGHAGQRFVQLRVEVARHFHHVVRGTLQLVHRDSEQPERHRSEGKRHESHLPTHPEQVKQRHNQNKHIEYRRQQDLRDHFCTFCDSFKTRCIKPPVLPPVKVQGSVCIWS